jgi:diguanylate cyclase (GGDEF)-like protein
VKEAFQFDLGTLYAIGIIISFLFGIVFLILARWFRQVCGAVAFALGFFCFGLGIASFLVRTSIPLTLSVLLANSIIWTGYVFFYLGIAQSLGLRVKVLFPIGVACLGLCFIAYFKVIHNNITIRMEIMSATNCLLMANIFIDLIRQYRRGLVIKLLAGFVGFTMLSNLIHGIATFRHGASTNIFLYDPVQALYIICALLAACGLGIFSLALIVRQVTAILEQGARRDPLTGALNRLGIEELLNTEVERSRRTRVPLALALLDIDHFKSFNDTGGHAAGDEVLRNTVATITRHLRAYAACGRLGGDEFLVLIPGCTAPDLALICDRILRDVAALPSPTPSGMSPTLSIGYTESDFGDTPASILARADRALYASKHQGRNCANLELPEVSPRPLETPADPTHHTHARL